MGSGGLKIRLSGFGVRKSGRERKPVTSRYGDYAESDDDSEASGKVRGKAKRKRRQDSVKFEPFHWKGFVDRLFKYLLDLFAKVASIYNGQYVLCYNDEYCGYWPFSDWKHVLKNYV